MNKCKTIIVGDDGDFYTYHSLPSMSRYDYEDGYVLSFSKDGYPNFGSHERYNIRKDKKCYFLFSTGKLDMNGSDIYDGDIVEINNKYENINKFVVRYEPEMASWICVVPGDVFIFPLGGVMSSKLKIVGNVHTHEYKKT